MTITAHVVTDSISEDGVRLTSLQLRYPRFIHAEFLTHRLFSRNASSSRAIPVRRLIADIEQDPVIPLHWGRNQPGMQADEEVDAETRKEARNAWMLSMRAAVRRAQRLADKGVHKQVVNRLLEPFAHINVLVTATDWDNFFELRLHPDAQPEIRWLAAEMGLAMNASDPRLLASGEWHLPYVSDEEVADYGGRGDVQGKLQRISTARAARVSYLTHEGAAPRVDKDLALYDHLVGAEPLHASPSEHQATPDARSAGAWRYPHLHGNFSGWIQHRKLIERALAPRPSTDPCDFAPLRAAS